MKARLAHLVEFTRDDGSRYMLGRLGDATVILEPGSCDRRGHRVWSLSVLPPQPRPSPAACKAESNRNAATERLARRAAMQN